MLATQTVIDSLADRIERAYRRRRPSWSGGCSTPRVWPLAAESLLRARESYPSLPIDPELYVRSQPCDTPYTDPWGELTRPEAVEHYRERVNAIILGLRRELAGEIRHSERRIGQGRSVARVLLARDRKLSPLGRYLVALRAGRPAIAERFLRGAVEQHKACPLYRQAASTFLPADLYPVPGSDDPPERLATPFAARPRGHFPSN